ncbi:hypothetical protein, partial [Sinorhizobium fredii]
PLYAPPKLHHLPGRYRKNQGDLFRRDEGAADNPFKLIWEFELSRGDHRLQFRKTAWWCFFNQASHSLPFSRCERQLRMSM